MMDEERPDQPNLEELLEFPCDYPFKAFGPQDEKFSDDVRAAVAAFVPVPVDCLKLRPSAKGQYQCVTVLTRLNNLEQLQAIYAALRQVENLKYLL